jgi:UDP-N-acetyl-D-mannosaminuronic acid dehydrogenase
MKNNKISIIGGGGHVGLPLSLKFAEKNYIVCAIDTNQKIIKTLNTGKIPYKEDGAQALFNKVLKNKKIIFTNDYEKIRDSKFIIITVGTPLNNNKPDMIFIFNALRKLRKYISKSSSIILRSTVYPGTTRKVIRFLKKNKINCKISYCPERVAQGKSLKEINSLTQIISAENEKEVKVIRKLFLKICKKTIDLTLEEAEYSKLFSNAWRYIKFGITNEFYTLCQSKNLNYEKIYHAMTDNYPRNYGLPKHGFAGGPCLPKDAIQLFFSGKRYSLLAKAAYDVNEGLPNFLVMEALKKIKLKNKNVCVLGTGFKKDIDDDRGSLSIKLIKLLKLKGANVYVYDPFINNKIELNNVLKKCKIIFLGVPHSNFKKINFKNKLLFNCWGNYLNTS